jgi:hypothetical protein
VTQIHNCLNCSAEIRTGPFCERCGQRNAHPRLEFRDLIDDIKTQLLEWDLPWLYTLRAMLLRPGVACREYMEGKRLRYVNPLRYLAYLTALVALLLQALPAHYGMNPFPDPPALLRTEVANPVSTFFDNHRILMLAALAPLIAILFRVLYSSTKYNNTEVSCFILFTLGNSLLLATLVAVAVEVVGVFWLRIPVVPAGSYVMLELSKVALILAVMFAHTVFTATAFFKEAWYFSCVKVVGVYIIYIVAFLMAMSAVGPRSIPGAAISVEQRGAGMLSNGMAWDDYEQLLVGAVEEQGRFDFALTYADYAGFLLNTGRTDDALYYLLRRDATPDESIADKRALLASAYMRRGQQEFALTQINAGATDGDILRLELAMERRDSAEVSALIPRVETAKDFNMEIARLWSAGDIPAALARIQLAVGTPGAAIGDLMYGARWAAIFDRPELAWFIFDKLPFEGKRRLWDSLWMPYFKDVRKLPAFKSFMRAEGLANYWRTTGNWADQCRAVGDTDFECF